MSAAPAAARERLPELVRIRRASARRRSVRAPLHATQRWRRAFQVAFLALNVAIGVQF